MNTKFYMDSHMIMLRGIVGNVLGQMLNVGLLEFAAGHWVYTKGLCPSWDFGQYSMDFSMVMQKKWGTMVI